MPTEPAPGRAPLRTIDTTLPTKDRYSLLRSRVADLTERVPKAGEGKVSDSAYKLILSEGELLSREFDSLVDVVGPKDTRGSRDYKKIDEELPDRGKVSIPISDAMYEAYKHIPLTDLTEQQTEDYMRQVGRRSTTLYSKHANGAYIFGFGEQESEGNRAVRQAVEEVPPDFDSPDEREEEAISTIIDHERKVFKVHVAVPSDRKQDVLQAIVAEKELDSAAAREIAAVRKAAGDEKIGVSVEEIAAHRGKSLGIYNWKIADERTSRNDPTYPTFVFYISPTLESPENRRDQIVQSLAGVLEPLDLPEAAVVPRYNTQAVVNGSPVPGLYWAQGDADIKKAIEKQGGKDLLGKYFDASVNYAKVKDDEGERSSLNVRDLSLRTGLSQVEAAYVLDGLRNADPVVATTLLSAQRHVPEEFSRTHEFIKDLSKALKGKWQHTKDRTDNTGKYSIVTDKYGGAVTNGEVAVFITSLLNTAVNGNKDPDVRRNLRKSWEKINRIEGMPDGAKMGIPR